MAGSKIRLYGSTSGYVELEAPAVSPDASLVLPSTFAGVGSNVVQTLKTDAFSTTSAAYVDVTGFNLSITPTTATSKILILFSCEYSNTATTGANRLQIERDGTTALGATNLLNNQFPSTVNTSVGYSVALLDSPATTSAVTYQVRANTVSGTMYVNARTDGFAPRVASLTAIEVEA